MFAYFGIIYQTHAITYYGENGILVWTFFIFNKFCFKFFDEIEVHPSNKIARGICWKSSNQVIITWELANLI